MTEAHLITSPRKLQEMLPTGDGHDVTAASGVSMKQYEDQLNGLRKENFHLKLRVYFLEEKLGTGAPPAVQGLLEHNVRLQVEVEELRRQLAAAEREAAAAAAARHQLQAPSDDERPTSPDQGIDSDRLSSLEQNDGLTLSPRSLYEENVTLKQKLARTKATLADTLTQLNAANMRKRSVQRAICREIHKTQGVLRKARDQFENQNQ